MIFNKDFQKGFYYSAGICVAVIFAFVIIVMLCTIKIDSIKDVYFLSKDLNLNLLSEKEQNLLHSLIRKNHVISADTIYTQTLAYYDTLITVLVSILGLVAGLAFFYVRFISQEKTEEYIEKIVKQNFETKKFADSVKDGIQDTLGDDSILFGKRLNKLEENVGELVDINKDKIVQEIPVENNESK